MFTIMSRYKSRTITRITCDAERYASLWLSASWLLAWFFHCQRKSNVSVAWYFVLSAMAPVDKHKLWTRNDECQPDNHHVLTGITCSSSTDETYKPLLTSCASLGAWVLLQVYNIQCPRLEICSMTARLGMDIARKLKEDLLAYPSRVSIDVIGH